MFNSQLKIVAIFTAFFVLISGLFIVDERQQALIIQFGEVIRTVSKPGLHFKVPLIQEAKFFEKRILNVFAAEKEVLAADQKRIIVNAFLKYKITDPLTFYQTVRDENGAKLRLIGALESSMRQVIGERPLVAMLTDKRSEIMSQIAQLVNNQTEKSGIKVVDVRISRADLPKENSAAIYSRMQTDREKEAKEFRAQGNEEALKIKSEAEKESKTLLANAKKQSEIIRGHGDAKAYKILTNTIGQDQDFYSFYRTLQAYTYSLKKDNTTIIMSPNNDFMRYLKTLRD
ncbi:protease modulator HflC [Rickettsiales endosymbiont of Stachyamoeba lipophora]|uniref:protease modulator HflC n=1 Tax=Rickettsiales endosymbiont of Stachyamoeba lipophora TaxID=2486578 RepID=UPI000F64C224|nr:protease modulator HflC [Rickettsiales endosymbiont of Stachyamoeba lipophora]AZL15647.1 protease modulator HflC [Rickettsiales endosymbiont of Stachyamoeba lipophora]